MNPITDPSNIAQRIALTEESIEVSNERLRALKQELRASARHALKASRKPLIFGGVAIVGVGLLLYPRRHAIAARARRVAGSPTVQMLMQRLPLIGMLLPLISGARHSQGATPGAKTTALITGLMPLLARFLPHASAGRRPPA